MSRRRKALRQDEVVGGTPPTALSVSVTLIAACKIGGVRRLPGEVLEIRADEIPRWRQMGLIADPAIPPV